MLGPCCVIQVISCAEQQMQTLKLGYVGHDHQSALSVAAFERERTKQDCGVYLKEVESKKHHELIQENRTAGCGGYAPIPQRYFEDHIKIGDGKECKVVDLAKPLFPSKERK